MFIYRRRDGRTVRRSQLSQRLEASPRWERLPTVPTAAELEPVAASETAEEEQTTDHRYHRSAWPPRVTERAGAASKNGHDKEVK